MAAVVAAVNASNENGSMRSLRRMSSFWRASAIAGKDSNGFNRTQRLRLDNAERKIDLGLEMNLNGVN